MANFDIGESVRTHVPFLEDFEIQDPRWLLMAAIPLILLIVHLWRESRVAERHWSNSSVEDASLADNSNWPRRTVTAIMLLSMLMLVYPAARPVNGTVQTQEKALLIWVYDASESMETADVAAKDGAIISRLEASVSALEESLGDIPPDFYKLLISFAGADEIKVGLPTLNSSELLAQANAIPKGERTATDFGLERAVSACRQFFSSSDNYPCEIFLLSDGECNPRPGCRIRSEEIATRAATEGIVIHTISWGDPTSEYRPNPEDLRSIAEIGRGEYLSSVETSELATLYEDVATGLDIQKTRQALALPYVWIARVLIIALAMAFWLRRYE